jgi:DNA ligase 1
VFEIAFEGIQLSPRHKSGVAVRFPHVAGRRNDKKPEEADTLDTLRRLTTLAPSKPVTEETTQTLFDLAEPTV